MPYRLSKLKKVLKDHGVVVSKGSGRHPWRAEKDGAIFPLTAHNGLKSEITDKYIQLLCRKLGLDEGAVFAVLQGRKKSKKSK